MQLLDEQVSNLMADHVGVAAPLVSEALTVIDYISYDDLVETEALLYPADELYGSWDTLWVNPFRTKDREVEFPDSFRINCQSFIIPIDQPLKVTSDYGPRRRRMHKGIDLKVQKGDTIRAAFEGKIRIKGYERRGYGYYLVIRHPNGLETIYGHLSKFLVAENDIVRAGTPVGLGGNTGRSTGSHLHFETRFLGQAINPNNIIDFKEGTVREPYYVVYKNNFNRGGNIYTSTSERIVYHRIKKGETLSQIALMYRTSVAELCRLNGLTRTSTLRIGQTLRCGTTVDKTKKEKEDSTAASETATGISPHDSTAQKALYHEVQPKETLSSIARKYNITVDALCKMNNIYATSKIDAGQQICYRAAREVKAETAETESAQIAEPQRTEAAPTQNGEPENAEVTVAAAPAPNDSENDSVAETDDAAKMAIYYRVKRGDTLSSIARQHGISLSQLCKMNNITSSTILQVGRSLRCS
ncbi:MAG: LysM peptidoglycan-binding domain-containing protein [Tannerella sp.]|nr:LysM peptidoglycan-binding domain-containing protein [Tannerella sp.]